MGFADEHLIQCLIGLRRIKASYAAPRTLAHVRNDKGDCKWRGAEICILEPRRD